MNHRSDWLADFFGVFWTYSNLGSFGWSATFFGIGPSLQCLVPRIFRIREAPEPCLKTQIFQRVLMQTPEVAGLKKRQCLKIRSTQNQWLFHWFSHEIQELVRDLGWQYFLRCNHSWYEDHLIVLLCSSVLFCSFELNAWAQLTHHAGRTVQDSRLKKGFSKHSDKYVTCRKPTKMCLVCSVWVLVLQIREAQIYRGLCDKEFRHWVKNFVETCLKIDFQSILMSLAMEQRWILGAPAGRKKSRWLQLLPPSKPWWFCDD